MTVVIPVYNMEKYVEEAVESVLRQTFRDFEVVVVDDGSTDRTPEVLRRYGSEIRVIRQMNAGGAAALNAGISEARGTWMAWLSADDVWEPRKLEREVEFISSHPEVALVYTDYTYIDARGRYLSREHFPCPQGRTAVILKLIRRCFINGSSTLIRRDVFEQIGMYDEADRLTPDWDLWLRIALRYPIAHVPEPLVRYRIHGEQTSTRSDRMERSAKRVVSRNVRRMGPFLGTLAAAVWLARRVRKFPALIRRSVAGNTLGGQLGDLLEAIVILVDAETTRYS